MALASSYNQSLFPFKPRECAMSGRALTLGIVRPCCTICQLLLEASAGKEGTRPGVLMPSVVHFMVTE